MNYTQVAIHVLDRIPVVMLCVMIGIVLTVLGIYFIHRSKKIPWKIIKTGTNGHTLVTADFLKNHCEALHKPWEEKFKAIIGSQEEIKKELIQIGKTTAYIEGRVG